MFYGPSRLVWFALGSLATWAWMRHRRECHDRPGRCPPRLEHHDRGSHARWQRAPDDTASSEPVSAAAAAADRLCRVAAAAATGDTLYSRMGSDAPKRRALRRPRSAAAVAPSPNGESASAGAGADGQPEPPADGPAPFCVDVDPERLRQMGRNAEETISGMSEATIDSVMGALQRLKDRLAERRGQQQAQDVDPQLTTSPAPVTPQEEPPRSRHWV
ncbi:hypothetical protein F5148DRAFT_1365513 [Russula earlei]|uniref:Uncharacterized protein n=1 Tax=Russula earlei TaxID=71964 RepID=A0ACC0UL80_9AGAM|nr:hypothetical protein F5148DRAFT_1365513 [Russula earlei]